MIGSLKMHASRSARLDPAVVLATVFLAALVWSGIECLDLQVSSAVRFAIGHDLPRFWLTHLSIGLAACLCQLLVLDGASAALAQIAKRTVGGRGVAVAEKLVLFGFHALVWMAACKTALVTGESAIALVGYLLLALAAWILPVAPWRERDPTQAVPKAIAAFAVVVVLHAFNRSWNPKFYFPIHVASTIFALTAALHGASYLTRRMARALEGRISMAVALVIAAAILIVPVVLFRSSNDVRHVLFNRAFDTKGILYVARKLRGVRASVTVPTVLAPGTTQPHPKLVERVLLISVDALRADHLPIYGYTRPTAPSLARFARGAAVFEWAWSAGPETSLALQAIFADDGVHAGLIGNLAKAGVHRTAVLQGPFMRRRSAAWLSAFERVATTPDLEDAQSADVATREIEADRFAGFMWVHLYAPHRPYDRHPSPDFGRTDLDIYDGEIVESDRAIERILSALERKGLAASTAVIVLGDHGEEFWEHGGDAHGWDIYNEQLHVPLIVRLPGAEPRRVQTHVTQRDLPLTILDLLGVPRPADAKDRSLVPFLRGEARGTERTIVTGPISTFKVGILMSGQWKLAYNLFNDSYALFDLASDRGERLNLFDARPEVSGPLLRMLQDELRSRPF